MKAQITRIPMALAGCLEIFNLDQFPALYRVRPDERLGTRDMEIIHTNSYRTTSPNHATRVHHKGNFQSNAAHGSIASVFAIYGRRYWTNHKSGISTAPERAKCHTRHCRMFGVDYVDLWSLLILAESILLLNER